MLGLIGKKIGMTSVYNEEGKNIPCTVVNIEGNVVTQIKTIEKDGYSAVQIGYGSRKEKNTPSAMKGHFKKAKTEFKSKLVEFRMEDEMTDGIKLAKELKVEEILEEGQFVDVSGVSKGKGFQGVVKRHGFSGVGESTHGQHNRQRAPGSIGTGSTPSRVYKGKRMAGRTGFSKIKVQNIEVVKIYPEDNLLVLKGATPGPNGSFLVIEK